MQRASDHHRAVEGKGDLRRAAIAWAIWTRTSGVSQAWIAERLNLRSAPNVCQQVRRFQKLKPKELPREIREWIVELGQA